MMMEEVSLDDTPLGPQLEMQDPDEPPDPRIQVELERLNTSTDLINKLEVDLDEGRMMFRHLLSESTQQINNLTKKLGKCIEQARPYYEARFKAKQSLTEAQKSAIRYERAVSQHTAAREMVQLAEEGLLTRGCVFDSTWQEMLNHATTKVNDAEREKIESASEHKEKSFRYHESEARVKVLQKELKRAITKSRPYFELKASVNQRLEEQKRHVRELENAVASAKTNYSQALANLETISDQIHKTRQNRLDLGVRGVGVGAESPGPPFSIVDNAEEAPPHGFRSDPACQADGEVSKGQNPKDCHEVKESLTEPASFLKSDQKFCSVLTSAKQNSIESGDANATESVVSQNLGTDFSGWQFVGYSATSGQSLLAVDDKDSVVSDSESLTSMEMLSEEAIANLMLEDEIQEATQSICSSLESPVKAESRDSTSILKDSKGFQTLISKDINLKIATLGKANSSDLTNQPSSEILKSDSKIHSSDALSKDTAPLSDKNRDSSSDSGGTWELVGNCSSNSNSSNKCSSQSTGEATSPLRPQTLAIETKPKQSSSSSSLQSSSPSEHSSADETPGYAPLCDTPETPHVSQHTKGHASDSKVLDI